MEVDKQLNLWERRVKGLRRMMLGWDQTKPPEAPVSVFVDVVDASTVSVKVHETTEGPMGTKFKGESSPGEPPQNPFSDLLWWVVPSLSLPRSAMVHPCRLQQHRGRV